MDTDMTTSGGFNLLIDLANVPVELQLGITAIANHCPLKNISLRENDDLQDVEFHWLLRFEKDLGLSEGECSVSVDSSVDSSADQKRIAIVVKYHRRIEAFRSLGRILGASRQIGGSSSDKVQSLLNYSEKSCYDNLALMIDCSRGGVLKQASVFSLLRSCSLMGINMVQLYTEDTYQIEGETFFGYLRGGYSRQELINIDDYADALGIELVPCIQTLGHLGQILQWPKYHLYRDTNEVLLGNWDETYNLIEKAFIHVKPFHQMITAVSSPLRSKRIHVGLDEAGGVGEGRFRQLFGYEDPTKVFINHIRRVQDICKKLDLQPMICAIYSSLAGYYDGGTPQLTDNLPPDIKLVYWDYYHTSSSSYTAKIQQHRELGCTDPWVATAAWTWNRFWCALPLSFATIKASCQASKQKIGGVKNMMITIWGDEGHECDMFSSLPSMYYFADHGYTLEDEVDLDRLKSCFEGVCGANFDDWVYASKIDQTPDSDQPFTMKTRFAPNPGKFLLWEAHISPQYAQMNLEVHYEDVAAKLSKAIEYNENYPQNCRLRMAYHVAIVLSLKCHLHARMVQAYQLGNIQELHDLCEGRLVDLQVAVDQLWKYHRSMWHKNNKPFGWEVLDLRYGGLRTRLLTMRERILDYIQTSSIWLERMQNQQDQRQPECSALSGYASSYESQGAFGMSLRRGNVVGRDDDDERPTIPEFEVVREPMYEYSGCNLLMDYARVSTPSRPG
ncbi:hypothetical protein BGZ94_008945 [Podila epigama]|nr:hypothetical protein BGZ94_008945 [Podila epigama]